MRYLNEKWKKLQRRVGNRSFRFMISMSFTFVALTGMILITAVLLNRYERTLAVSYTHLDVYKRQIWYSGKYTYWKQCH